MDAEWDNLMPFAPAASKDSQFLVAAALMTLGLTLTGLFSINKSIAAAPLLAIPASVSLGFGSVFLICAVGVYV